MNCKTILLATVAQAVKINQGSTDFPLEFQGDHTLASVLAQTGPPVSEEDCVKEQNINLTVNMDEVHYDHDHSDDDNSGNGPSHSDIMELWQSLDQDEDGLIDLADIAREAGPDYPYAVQLMNEGDKNGDSFLNFDEFVNEVSKEFYTGSQ